MTPAVAGHTSNDAGNRTTADSTDVDLRSAGPDHVRPQLLIADECAAIQEPRGGSRPTVLVGGLNLRGWVVRDTGHDGRRPADRGA